MDRETTHQIKRRIIAACPALLERIEAGADKKTVAMETFPEVSDRLELFLILDTLAFDRLTALRTLVEHYKAKKPLANLEIYF